MKRSYFCPDNYMPDGKLVKWAKDTFRIDGQEVLRQLELMKDHEFRRGYSCWNRVFRNWLRKADEISTLQRERVYRTYEVVEPTPEEKEAERRKWQEQMERFEKMRAKA